MNKLVSELVNQLDATLREEFEERAAIIEFEAGYPREHAECLAVIDVLFRHPEVLNGVIVLRVEREGATQWLLTTDVRNVRHRLAKVGTPEIVSAHLGSVIDQHFGGAVLLAAGN